MLWNRRILFCLASFPGFQYHYVLHPSELEPSTRVKSAAKGAGAATALAAKTAAVGASMTFWMLITTRPKVAAGVAMELPRKDGCAEKSLRHLQDRCVCTPQDHRNFRDALSIFSSLSSHLALRFYFVFLCISISNKLRYWDFILVFICDIYISLGSPGTSISPYHISELILILQMNNSRDLCSMSYCNSHFYS